MYDPEQKQRLQESDHMLCTNIESLQFKHKYESDVPFMQLLSKPIPNCIRDVTQEHTMWTQTFKTRTPGCSLDLIMTRGGNASGMKQKTQSEFLMPPCWTNTFQNYLVEDDKKVCSKSHQLFNNLTRRV